MIFTRKPRQTNRNGEGGYALLMVLFLVATLLIFATVATLKTHTEGQREKEEELAWRGNQYVRAVRLFYKKNGRFPQSIDDLTKYHTDQPRFIRQAYKDPMNTDDGSWRLIYVLPNGQLVGSVMHKAFQGSLMAAAGNPLGNSTSTGSAGQPTGAGSTQSSVGQQSSSTGQTTAASSSPQPGQDQSGGQGQVFGGSLTGFASKVKKPSIRVYQGGTTYYEWEFIYDPTAQNGIAGGGAAPPTTPATGTPPGTAPTGAAPPGTPPNSQNQQQNPGSSQ
jgi:hypothetical protein